MCGLLPEKTLAALRGLVERRESPPCRAEEYGVRRTERHSHVFSPPSDEAQLNLVCRKIAEERRGSAVPDVEEPTSGNEAARDDCPRL